MNKNETANENFNEKTFDYSSNLQNILQSTNMQNMLQITIRNAIEGPLSKLEQKNKSVGGKN